MNKNQVEGARSDAGGCEPNVAALMDSMPGLLKRYVALNMSRIARVAKSLQASD